LSFDRAGGQKLQICDRIGKSGGGGVRRKKSLGPLGGGIDLRMTHRSSTGSDEARKEERLLKWE